MKRILFGIFVAFFSIASFGDDVVLKPNTPCTLDWCTDWRAAYNTDKTRFATESSEGDYYAKEKYLLYRHDETCCGIKCRDGHSFISSDNYNCTVCQENGGNMGYRAAGDSKRSTEPCYWCGYGTCYNPTTYKCETCTGRTMDDMKRCLLIVDTDEFKKCLTGL